MSLPRFSVRNRALVNMLMIVILVAGAGFSLSLVREMFPESRPDKLMISAVDPGVQPQEIEKAITIKIEEAVRDIEGVDKVDSTVGDGFTSTVLTLLNDVHDVDAVLQDVKTEVDAIQDFPEDLEQITVAKFVPKLPVISVAIYGSGDEPSLKRAARRMRDDLLLLPGVSDVRISGTRDDEISVEVRPEKLLEYDITFDEVAEAIRRADLDVSGGQLRGSRARVAVRTLGEKERGSELESLVVRSEPDGRQVRLSDVAVIRDQFVETDLKSYFNGKRSVNCTVYKTAAQDAIQIADEIKAYVKGKQHVPFDLYGYGAAYEKRWFVKPFALGAASISWLVGRINGRPDPMQVYEQSRRTPFDHNFQVALHTDLSRFVEGRLNLMLRNGFSGLILVLISLNLFLNWRIALWTAMGLPVAFLGTFMVMWFAGVTINLISLFGLIIVLGIIVDDAIVIGENIYRHIEAGMPPIRAAVVGAEEVMWPVTVAVTTTIAAFLPLFFIKGQIGDFMRQLPLVVISALSVSLLEALLILPAHLAHVKWKKRPVKRAAIASKSGRFKLVDTTLHVVGRLRAAGGHDRLVAVYERLLRLALRWRYVTVVTACGTLLIAFGLVAGGIVETTFIQKMDSETLICSLEMPVGTPAEQVHARLEEISDFVVAQPETENVQMHVARQYDVTGTGALGVNDQSHLGQLIIELQAADIREQRGERSSEQLLAAFRRMTDVLPGVNSVAWQALNGGPGGKAIDIRVSGKDFNEILLVAGELKLLLRGYAGVSDLDDDFDTGKREVRLRLRPTARLTGITTAMLGNTVRSALFGREARRITRNREDVRIMVRFPERFRKNVHNIESMWIPTGPAAGARGWVPLGQVAELTEAESYNTIHRSQQQRSVTVFGDVDQEVANDSEILADVRRVFETRIQPKHAGVRIEFLGQAEERAKAFGSLKLAVMVSMLLIFLQLTGMFRSYYQPLVVMMAIPFGVQGAIIGHLVTGYPMTVLSGIGLVALTGIVVNDSLVLVDFINTLIRQGVSPFEANVRGSKLRLRAILLTTLTTVAGLTPLMFETSFQAKFLIPMAVTLTFGLMFATALTLVLVPSLNLIFFDLAALFGKQPSVLEPLPEEPAASTVSQEGCHT